MDFFRLQTGIDTREFLHEATRYPHFWNVKTVRQDTVSAQRETQTIMLRDGVFDNITPLYDSLVTKDMELYSWFPKTREFMNKFIEFYGGELGRVYVVSLPLNKQVYPHFDEGKYYQTFDRFHFVLTGKYVYHIENEPRIFEEGDLWFFDNQKVHHSETIGVKDRIAIIFDVKDSNWRNVVQL